VKRIIGAVLFAGAALSGLLQAVCRFTRGTDSPGSFSFCDVPQPDGVIAAAAVALGAWWFLLRKPPQSVASQAPSPAERVLAMLAYTAVTIIIASVLGALFMSRECIALERCGRLEETGAIGVGVLFLVLEAAVVILGWSGRLPGLRRRSTSSTDQPPARHGAA